MGDQTEWKYGQISLDEPTIREIMSYYRFDNHDELVRYIAYLGIEHDD